MQRIIAVIAILLSLTLPAQSAVDLDGTDDLFTIAQAISSFITASTGTMMLWVTPVSQSGLGTNCAGTSAMMIGDNGGWAQILRDADTGWCAFSEAAGSVQSRAEDAAITNGALNHVVWRHTGGNLSIIINGTVHATVAAGNTGSLTDHLRIGNATGYAYFNGRLHRACVFNVAVPDAEIQSMAGARRHRIGTTQPTGCWDFSTVADGSSFDGVTVPDRSGNNFALTGDNGAGNANLLSAAENMMSYRRGVQ